MNGKQERLVHTNREAIRSRDMVLYQASSAIEFIAPKSETVVPKVAEVEQRTFVQQINPQPYVSETSTLTPNTDVGSTGSEELDQAAFVARIQQEVASTYKDIEAEAA